VQGQELPKNGGQSSDWLRSAMTHKRAIPAPGNLQQTPDAETRAQVRWHPMLLQWWQCMQCSGRPHAPVVTLAVIAAHSNDASVDLASLLCAQTLLSRNTRLCIRLVLVTMSPPLRNCQHGIIVTSTRSAMLHKKHANRLQQYHAAATQVHLAAGTGAGGSGASSTAAVLHAECRT
jgi:hypothetical protein